MEYAPNVRFCELMLNGEYQGIYVLTELIGSGRDGARLNMEVDARDNTYTGYLLRLDRQDGSEYDRLNSLTTYSYRNEMELKLEVEFPGEKKLTPEIKEAIKTDFSAFEKGLYSYDYDSRKYGYRAQVDVDSFVDYLILNEFTTNYDAGSYSTYIYRDVSGRLKMCVWDFNNACDNYQEQTTMQVQHFDVHRKLWFTLDFLPLDRTGNRRFVPVMVYPERAEVHILEDEQASREYINQMWAEAMEIYRSGNFRLRFSPAMNAYLKAHQKDFMPEDTKAGQILDYLERYSGSMVCSKQLYKEALGHDYDEPKQWELREINDIMNNAVTGWRAFSNPRYFPEPYRRQKGWERIRNDNEPDNSMDGFQEIPTEEMEQLGLPEEWLKQK